MDTKPVRRNSECLARPKECLKYRLNHKVEEEVCHEEIRMTLKIRPKTSAAQSMSGEGQQNKDGRLRVRSSSCSDAVQADKVQLVGWKDRAEFMSEELKKWEFDPILQTYHKHKLEKSLFDKSLPPIPDITLATPHRAETCKKKRVKYERKQEIQYPLDTRSVHYQETGTSIDQYWEKCRDLREKKIQYAFSHRVHHTGYGLKASLARPSCVFTPGPRPTSTHLKSPPRRHRGLTKSASVQTTSCEPQVVRIRCSTASRHFSTAIPRTPWHK